jgi:hypothetical protein
MIRKNDMAYRLTSRAPGGRIKIRHLPHPIAAYDAGCMAVVTGETDLCFTTLNPTEWPITETQIRETLATRAAYREAYERAGLSDPYHGAPF